MSTQIAVRLSDELVRFVDEQVRSGNASSRADVVQRALERERRRQSAERDAAIYAAEAADDDEFAGMRARAARRTLDID